MIPSRTLFPIPCAKFTKWLPCLCALVLSSPLVAETSTPQQDVPTLLDAWLSMETLPEGQAFYLRSADIDVLEWQALRLQKELADQIDRQTQAGATDLAEGLAQWQRQLVEPATLRTPVRADLVLLTANPRLAPRLSSLDSYGACRIPDWLEIWNFRGVTRLDWQPGSRLIETLERMPRDAYRSADDAKVITPSGTTHTQGIAAWNEEDIPLTPGSRIIIELSPDNPSMRWINDHLPAYLAARMPGNDCTLYTPDQNIAHDDVH
ncbi:capsule biosynthesis GfcC family protein [Litchfieldella rifensis]|uniref:Capsule biosynthesis GfcC family protein n=1 Tax=Litchfieldella rifensis TaxID=762643 RepID=A0ABV7LN35_9GAMM